MIAIMASARSPISMPARNKEELPESAPVSATHRWPG
jgi:hypothetical protein